MANEKKVEAKEEPLISTEHTKEDYGRVTPPLPEQIVLSKEQFETMMTDIKILKKSVSRYKLEENEAKERGEKKGGKRGHCLKLNGEVIVKWLGKGDAGSQAKSEILYNGTTPIGETLKGHYITITGKEIVTDAVNFYRSNDIEYFDVLEELPNGNWSVRFLNPDLPQEYEFNPKYNAA